MELLQDLQGWRNIGFTLSIFLYEFGQSDSEFLPNQILHLICENPIWLLVPEKVKISFIFFKLFTNEIKLISQLVVPFGNIEEVLTRNGLNNTVGLGHELLQLLSIITDEAVCTET